MTYVFLGGLALLACLALFSQARRLSRRVWMRGLRYGGGGLAAILTVALLVFRRIDLAVFTGAAAFSLLRRGRLGPWSLEAQEIEDGQVSTVRSHYFKMALDHDSGAVAGKVTTGDYAGRDLYELDEDETRALIAEVSWDTDSTNLLESWLDANRQGWREYFAGQGFDGPGEPGAAADPLAEAYEILGLAVGATEADVRAAHRELMKGVHPDHGGSSYLAAKINQARDRLLDHLKA